MRRPELTPLRAALLADAQAAADRELARAESECAESLSTARADAEALVARAQASARARAQARARHELAAARRDASRAVLEAQRAAYDALQRDTLALALALRDDPRYPSLLDILERRVLAMLGSGARIERDPPGRGGVIGHASSRTVDATLPALAERALDELGEGVEALWQ